MDCISCDEKTEFDEKTKTYKCPACNREYKKKWGVLVQENKQ